MFIHLQVLFFFCWGPSTEVIFFFIYKKIKGWIYAHYCGVLLDLMSALYNEHYGFGHHYKWLSFQIVHNLRV